MPDTSKSNEIERRRRVAEAGARALAEARERRKQNDGQVKTEAVEKGGQDGPDPARYGDWEKDGIASDF